MTFVVSNGQLAALERVETGWPQSSVRITERLALSYADIWRTQPQVRTVVDFLARNVADLGMHVFRRVSDTDRERLRDHPLAVLLARPNPYTTRYRLMDSLVHDMGIHDNAVWLKFRTAVVPAALLRLDPSKVEPLGTNPWWPEKYRYRGSKGPVEFATDQIVHFRGYNPVDARWGVSPLETLRRILVEEYEAGNWREQLWRNGARFPGYIKRPMEAPDWSDGAHERFSASWRGLYTGDGPATGGTPILEDGMEFHASGITPEQAQYLQTRKLTREEVAAAFHIPLPMVGILEHATFSNIEEQHRNLYQDTLGPWLTMITEEIALQLLPDLDTDPDVYVEFNLSQKLRGDFEKESRSLQTAVGGPWMTRNEARARQNLPQLDEGDDLIVPMNVTQGGQASPTDSAPKAVDRGRVDDLARRFTERQAQAVRSGKDLDPGRWRTELTDDVLALMEV